MSSIGAYEYAGPSASLQLTPSAAKVLPGQAVTLRGRLTLDGTVVADRQVSVWKRVGSGGWTFDSVAPFVSAGGYYEASRAPAKRTLYAMYFSGDDAPDSGLRPSQSNVVAVSVATIARVASLNRRSVSRGARLSATTRVSGPEPSTVRFRAYRFVKGRWKFYRAFAPTSKKWGYPARRYSASIRLRTRGVWRFRVWVKDENGIAWGLPSAKVRVR